MGAVAAAAARPRVGVFDRWREGLGEDIFAEAF